VAVDLDLSIIEVRVPNLELRQDDKVAGPVERGSFGLITARAVLHHVGDVEAAIENLAASVRPRRCASAQLSLIFSPSASPSRRRSERFGMDGSCGRATAGLITASGASWRRLAPLGLTQISGDAETAIYNGSSRRADYWTQTIADVTI
jgi:hypothetical protein